MDIVARHLRQHPQFAVGRAEADAAIASNALAYRLNGKLDWGACERARETLSQRFGAQLVLDGHDVVDADRAARDEGFNERMQEEFISRFGEDVVTAVIRELERERKKRR